MKHTILTLLLTIAACLGAHADELVSGESYRICSLDGQLALTNGGSAANNTILRMATIDLTDQGQVWELTESDGYWQIKSAVGNVCADNPSESHTNWGNQLLQWQTSGGTNQKWTFKSVGNDAYELIPYESSTQTKGYGYDADGKLTFQATGADNTRFLLKKVASTALQSLPVNGYYAIQAVSAFPDYHYKAEGRFLKFSGTGVASLATAYTYENCRLLVATDADGHTTITLPQSDKYVYATSSSVKAADTSNDSYRSATTFMFYADNDTLTLDTRIAFGIGESTPSSTASSIKSLVPNASGSGLTLATRAVASNFTFRLVALPAEADVDALAQAIAAATTAAEALPTEQAAAVQAAVAKAQSELDYPYLTKNDVKADIAALTAAVKEGQEAAGAKSQPATGITEATTTLSPSIANGIIRVPGAKRVSICNAAGQILPLGQRLPAGTYVVTADGQTFKVTL